MQLVETPKHSSWLDRPIVSNLSLSWESVAFATILILALFTRFYNLEARVMSHDETSHVYFSWLFEQGRGYSHDPVTHGPMQFHLVALSYFLLGDNDFSARVPAALFSVATVLFMWNYRKLLGRAGALIAAVLLVISPYILYYGRYVRNEAFVGLFGVVMLWAILRYLQDGSTGYLTWLIVVTSLHFATKETAFIYQAQALIFLAGLLVYRLSGQDWPHPEQRPVFMILLLAGITLLGGGMLLLRGQGAAAEPLATVPAVGVETAVPAAAASVAPVLAYLLLILAALALIGAIFFVVSGFTWQRLRSERAFDLLILTGTSVLPMLAAFPVKLMGINPIDYNSSRTIAANTVFIVLMFVLAVAVGLLWNWRVWLVQIGIFYGIFIVLYTSLFTNGFGAVTGLVGSLGYWLEQQGVNRGSQPWYFYGLIQVPLYEFLPALGMLLAAFFAPRLLRRQAAREALSADSSQTAPQASSLVSPGLTITLLVFWSLTSLIAYTVAGEKMPWLTFHIALPMILSAAWYLGQLVESVDWPAFFAQRGLLVLLILPVFFLSLLGAFGSALGANPPFQGKELEQLRATSTFITALLTAAVSGWVLARLVQTWEPAQFRRAMLLTFFGLLAVITARASFRASYINYDYATEYLVYAHSAPGPKVALEQIEEISRRTTDGLAIRVAYDNETTYPFWWYLRNYKNQDYYNTTPSRAQREAPVILVGEGNYGKIEPVVGQAYYQFDYVRLWWPNQDYFGLTWERIFDAFSDSQMRTAIFNIWLNRDFTLYGQLTNKDMSLPNWYPANRMRLYVRKDIAASLWNYGVSPAAEAVVADPYEGKQLALTADRILGAPGAEAGQFQRPRGLASAPDGSLYVADANNHRIQRISPQGEVLQTWGRFADAALGDAPGGTFNEPWGVGVGPDGSVYVADTWNHRVQKFSAEGAFIRMWGYFGQAEAPEAFWGPRDVAVDAKGRVYVTDTGNKRVAVFDGEGRPLGQFGSPGLALGEFDEPVGLTIGPDGTIYVADTWNQRIQAFTPSADGTTYQPLREWPVVAWYGQSLDNKPFLAAGPDGHVFASDPEGYRVLEFTAEGEFVRYWGDLSSGANGFTLVGGVAVVEDGSVWVSDAGAGRVLHFTLP